MSFLVPGLALAALVAGALPLILHFLLRRPRSTAWPSNMLLQRALERLRRRRRVDAWLLLALRVLGITIAGIAMAGPFLGNMGTEGGSREIWIVIDDGATSAETFPDGKNALQSLQDGILEELSTLRAGDRVAIVHASKPARIDIAPTLDHERARARIRECRPEPVPSDLRAAMELALPPDAEAPPREVLLASTLRRGSIPTNESLPAAWRERSRNVRWRSLAAAPDPAPNRWIESVSTAQASDPTEAKGQVAVRIDARRTGNTSRREDVQIRSDSGNVIAQSDTAWPDGSLQIRADLSVPGTQDAAWTVQLQPDSQPLDDARTFVNVAGTTSRVAIIGRQRGQDGLEGLSASGWILRAMEAANVPVREVDPSMLALRPPSDCDVVIVTRPDLVDAAGWKWCSRHLRDGGLLVIMPVPEVDASWSADLERECGMRVSMSPQEDSTTHKFAARQPRTPLLAALGAEIDALTEPVSIRRAWNIQMDRAEKVLTLESGEPAVLSARSQDGRGLLVLLAFPPELDCTDMPLRPLMVPFFQEVTRAGRALALGSNTIRSGEIGLLGPSASGGVLRSMDPQRKATIEIDNEGRTSRPIPFPGLWKLEQRDGRERWIATWLDPASTSIERVDSSEIEAWWSPVGSWSRAGSERPGPETMSRQGAAWTMPLLVIALLLLVAESLWSRRSSPRPPMEQVA